ncbi:MAG: HAD family hydrolase [Terriglobia bacterium]
MLRAIIFDFDGVIVDSEPVILELTQRMAAREGWALSAEEYYRDYLALDDRGTVEHLFRSHGKDAGAARRDELLQWKSAAYAEAIRDGLRAVPGAAEFVQRCRSAGYPLAIASGSLREEVESLLSQLGLRQHFSVIATADDCAHSKPDPGIYLEALARLQRLEAFGEDRLTAAECLAIEDAPAGVNAAHAAGMKCLAITHSRPLGELGHADWVFDDFGSAAIEVIAKSL